MQYSVVVICLERLPPAQSFKKIPFCERKVLLILDRSHSNPQWKFIGGQREPGEKPLDTAVREMAEEGGVRLPPQSFRIAHNEFPSGHLRQYFICEADFSSVPRFGTEIDCIDGRRVERKLLIRKHNTIGQILTGWPHIVTAHRRALKIINELETRSCA